uniref:Uncharacterized protein n=1 Tax=Anopheles farauti TaxID=69004 RepID=A0A182Q8T8_9DIPT
MEASSANKLRPMMKTDFSSRLLTMKDVCNELAAHERRCEDKLNRMHWMHGKMMQMMQEHMTVEAPATDQNVTAGDEGEEPSLVLLRTLQTLIEQKRSLEDRNCRLEQAIMKFKQRFEKVLG